MRKVFTAFLGVAVASAGAFATTKTVGPSGAQFTSIQAAIDSFTEAEITDGQPDEVVVAAGEYDEQVSIGCPEVTESSPANFLDAPMDLAKRRDPFTLRGADANNRPVIDPISVAGKTYSCWPGDAGDNFSASLAFYGMNITIENVEIVRSGGITDFQGDDQYGLNGQASNMVFKNVLFQVGGDGDSLINFNNSAVNIAEGFDNSYQFIDCEFDGSFSNDGFSGSDGIYFHGFSAGDATEAGIDPAVVLGADVLFDGCTFREFEVTTMIRGNAQKNKVTVRNSFLVNNKRGLRANGACDYLVENSIFYQNAATAGDEGAEMGGIEVNGRGGRTAALTVRNSLFVDNLNAEAYTGLSGLTSRSAAIRVKNDGNDGVVTIENCTFVNNPVALRFVDSAGRPRTGVVSNNIFQGSTVAVFSADDAPGSYFTAPTVGADGSVTALTVTGSGNVFDGNAVVVEDGNLLPNVNIQGAQQAVTFTNARIIADDPFNGPPYLASVSAGANLGQTNVDTFMLY